MRGLWGPFHKDPNDSSTSRLLIPSPLGVRISAYTFRWGDTHIQTTVTWNKVNPRNGGIWAFHLCSPTRSLPPHYSSLARSPAELTPFSVSGPRNASRTPCHFLCWIGPSHRPGRHLLVSQNPRPVLLSVSTGASSALGPRTCPAPGHLQAPGEDLAHGCRNSLLLCSESQARCYSHSGPNRRSILTLKKKISFLIF